MTGSSGRPNRPGGSGPTGVRPELPGDALAVRALNEAAFETDVEARIVDTIRGGSARTLSLVAESEGALVREGLERCRNTGCHAVVVLGHPEYYPRFGFVPASRYGIGCEYDVPDEVFMLVELEPGALEGVSGRVAYHPAFSGA
jgi:putative acetyltransferase